ncbi:MAG: hypothetical protein RQ751_13600 [Longimicrobiales bacterium]|nr:hypothetical protein [Longimicrobiales bacterium]
MRRFTDRDGAAWEVVVGRESWGLLVALFVPADGSRTVRQAPLSSADHGAAEAELDRMGPEGLQRLLDDAAPRTL